MSKVNKVTGPKETAKVTLDNVKVDSDLISNLNKQMLNIYRYRTATFNAWAKVGSYLTRIKKAFNGDTKLFGMYLTKMEKAGNIPVIGKDNRSSSMTIAGWIADGFDKSMNIELTFMDWRSKYAGNKSSPNTLVKAVNKYVKAEIAVKAVEDDKAQTVALPDADAVESATDTDTVESATDADLDDTVDKVIDKEKYDRPLERVPTSIADLSTLSNDKLVELFGLIQTEIIGRYQSERMNNASVVDIVKYTRALKAIIAPVKAPASTKAKWTNTI